VKRGDALALLGLSAVWGSSYLLMHWGAAEFGALPLAALRAALAAAVLLPLAARAGHLALMRRQWKTIVVVGLGNSALPFVGFAYASTHIATGLASVFGAAAPLFGALIAVAWLGERQTPLGWAGLALGLAGVFGLAWGRGPWMVADGAQALAVAACLAATLGYGFSANLTRRRLTGVPPLAVAAGSQLGAALALAAPAAAAWPAALPSAAAWASVAVLAVVGTGFAYVVFYGLVARIGPTRSLTVAFLIPLWALLLGALALGEVPDPGVIFAAAAVLAGTLLANLKPAAATLAGCRSSALPPQAR
jgi:drug/metabolite transporter (DMT)-like permease